MSVPNTIAAVDLGSNSFRLQVARVSGGQIYPLDSLKETVRLAAGLTEDKQLDAQAQQRALECLSKFGQRLRGLPGEAVRAVGTNTLRVAKNAPEFLRQAQRRLGFPIEVVAGHEEARLIYLGVAHALPSGKGQRLVVDIGGGSTEIILGSGFAPKRLESLYMGCVGHSRTFFPNGKITARRMREAELAAATELQTLGDAYSRPAWVQAIGSSGTARALSEIMQYNGWSDGGISAAGISKLRKALIKAGDARRLDLPGVREDRKPVLAGGFAIMAAVFDALGIGAMATTDAGLREGVLWDMLGRLEQHDVRDTTVAEFMRRYHVDTAQAVRVERLAQQLYRQLVKQVDPATQRQLTWAARLHEIGLSIAYSGYHRHSAYILEHADMPGFSRNEQSLMGHMVLGHRGALVKTAQRLVDAAEWTPLLALRLATLFLRGRHQVRPPKLALRRRQREVTVALDSSWLRRNALIATALAAEVTTWRGAGLTLRIDAKADLFDA